MSTSRLILLGGFRLYRADGSAVPLAVRKGQALLSYLALQPGRRCSRDRLAALLWEDSSTPNARQSLRQVLTDLRRLLPRDEPILDTEGEDVGVIPDALEVDVHEFEQLLDEGTPEAQARAVELYQGRFLEGFDPRASAFEDWLMAERSRLHELALGALQQRVEHERASNATARAIRSTLHLLSLDPLRESAHRALMELYCRQGHYGAALKQYRVCQRTLRRELDVAPEQETQRLFRRIMEQRQSAADEPAEPPLQSSPAEPRPATVLLARASGAGHRAASMDHHPELEDCIRSCGGQPLQQRDDEVLAVFGLPKAHSDDAQRAVRAALAVRDMLSDTRIGVASGRVVSGDDERPAVTGKAVDRARELASRANAGEIHLGASLYASVSRDVHAEPVTGDENTAWRLRGLVHDRPAARPGFVGRTTELRQCLAAIEACREIGRGQSLLVRGEAGIGKSRLLEECAAFAERQGYACHKVLVLDFGSRWDPVHALVSGLLQLTPDAGEEDLHTAARRAVSEGRIDPERRGELHDLLGLPQPPESRVVFEAMDDATRRERRKQVVADLIRAGSRNRPLLVLVEDIHWADRETLDHLARVAATVADCPALLLMTHRIEGEPLDPAWRGAMHGAPLTTIDLGPLRDEEIRALAADLAPADDEFVHRCSERAGGNPWFLEQLLRSGVADDTVIPDSVRSLVWARLDGLDARDKRAAQAAAVLGQRFPAAALHHVLDDHDYEAGTLLAQHLLQAEGDDYRFSHDLIREGIHESLTTPQQRSLHARAAGWFRERDPILLAQHLDRAGSPEAVSAYRDAAMAQIRDYRYEQARNLLTRGLELAREPAERHALLRPRAELLHELGDIDAAIDAYQEAAELAANDEHRCEALLGVAAGHGVRDRHDDALAVLRKAESLAGQRPRLLARLHTLQGNLFFPLGRMADCLKAHQRARKHAREAGSAELEARALSGLGDAAYLRGRMITARGHFDRCVELARANGLARIEASNLCMRGITCFYSNELEAARRDTGDAIELAARIAHARADTVARTSLITVLCYQADWMPARQVAEQGLELARRLGAPRFEAEILMHLGLIGLGRGDRVTAERTLDDAYALGRHTSLAYVGPWILAALAATTTDAAKRRQALAEGESLLAESSVSHNHLHFRQLAIEVALEDGDRSEALRHCTALADYTRSEPLPWSEFFIARGRALAAWTTGQRGDDERLTLQRLREEAEAVGLYAALPPLKAALAEA